MTRAVRNPARAGADCTSLASGWRQIRAAVVQRVPRLVPADCACIIQVDVLVKKRNAQHPAVLRFDP